MEEKEQFNQDMAESSKVYSLENIWFGLKRKRRDVVFNTPIQTFHSDSQVCEYLLLNKNDFFYFLRAQKASFQKTKNPYSQN